MADWLIGFYIFQKTRTFRGVFFFPRVIETDDPDPKYNKEENRGLHGYGVHKLALSKELASDS